MAQSTHYPELAEELAPPERLALAYAPAAARALWTGLLVLDRRLGRASLGAREPVLAQIRLAWWRDRFRSPPSEWPQGEPLLAVLASWGSERGALERLVDGWELAVGDPDAQAIAGVVEARAEAVLALARLLGCPEDAALVGVARQWAQADLAAIIPGRCETVAAPAGLPRVPRAMRPLAVLAELASARPSGLARARAMARIIRLGLLGR